MLKTQIEIIYQDNDIIVINKPTGVSVTKDRSGAAELLDILNDQLGPQISSQLRLVHRLDKHTSGVMILAKNAETQSVFSSYFEKKLIKKTYLALVTGVVPDPQGTINTRLARSRRNPALMCITRKKGKEAVTDWKLLADFGTVALLVVKPLTGRTHQIRVHLPGIGLPLAIDPLYGAYRPLFLSDFKADYRLSKGQTEKPLIDRLTLHAYQIVIPAEAGIQLNPEPNPVRSKRPEGSAPLSAGTSNGANRPAHFIARLDKKFTATVKMLTRHNPKGLDAFTDPDDFSKIINARKLN
jgi:RluA family pseudouridine synthase